jgi:cysteine desulfurase
VAREAMLAALEQAGNASSVHEEGRRARRLIETARREVAALAGADPALVTFVSGGSEANATVLSPRLMLAGQPMPVDTLLVSAVEHPSVLAGGRFAEGAIETLAVGRDGLVDLAGLEARLDTLAAAGRRMLVSVMLANNETGAIQPVAEIACRVHAAGGYVHTDAVQAAGRLPLDIAALGVDFLTLSAHKIGGPQGAGAIVCATEAVGFPPLIAGGGQEHRHRAGTENVAAIAGFGAAAAAARSELSLAPRWLAWRDAVAATIRDLGTPSRIFSEGADRLPQTLCFGLMGVAAETLVIALDLAGVAVSAGAACSSGKVGPSHVMTAMGEGAEWSRSAVRISMGWETSQNDLDMLQTALRRVYGQISAGGDVRAA